MTAPSPNHEPEGTPEKVVLRPSSATLSTLSIPSITPIQWTAGCPSTHTVAPA